MRQSKRIEIRPGRNICIDCYLHSPPTKDRLFLFHGSSGSPHHWRKILPELSRQYDCIVPTFLGHGDSEKPIYDFKEDADGQHNPYSFMQLAADMQAVLEKYGNEDGHNIVLGHSRGAMIALYLAEQHPDKIKRLVLLCPDTFSDDMGQLDLWQVAVEELEAIRPQLDEAYQHMAFDRRTDQQLIDEESAAAAEVPMYVVQALKLGKIDRPQLDVSHIKLPTTILAGKNDLVVPTSKIKAAYESMPHVNIKVIEQAGHMLMLEQPQQVIACI